MVLFVIVTLLEDLDRTRPPSSLRVTVNPSIVTQEIEESRKPLLRRPISVLCAPGLPPPMLTYSPAEETKRNSPAGRERGAPPVPVRRTPSTKTCLGLQVTLLAS